MTIAVCQINYLFSFHFTSEIRYLGSTSNKIKTFLYPTIFFTVTSQIRMCRDSTQGKEVNLWILHI